MKSNSRKRVYPIVITPPSGGKFYLAYAPDIDRMTQGETLAEVLEMAEDLISVHGLSLQDDGMAIPEPSAAEPPHKAGELVSWVTVDFDAYRRANDVRSVRRNVSLPSWLNFEAERAGINVSALLQAALIRELKPGS